MHSNATPNEDLTPLHVAARCNDFVEAIEILKVNDLTCTLFPPPLQPSSRSGHNSSRQEYNETGNKLDEALGGRSGDETSSLVNSQARRIADMNTQNRSPTENKKLLEIPDMDGFTPLLRAVESDSWETAMVFLLAAPDAGIKLQSILRTSTCIRELEDHPERLGQQNILDLAARLPNANFLERLLKYFQYIPEFKEFLRKLDSPGRHDLKHGRWLHCLAEHGALEGVEILMRWRVRLEIVNEQGQTALHVAANRGHRDVVNSLLQHEIPTRVLILTDSSQSTALHLAAKNGHADICRTLIDRGINPSQPDGEKFTAFELAIRRNHLECVKVFCEKRDAKQPFSTMLTPSLTPLHLAALLGHESILVHLLKTVPLGHMTNETPPRSAFEIALAAKKTNIAKRLLMEEGSEIFLKDFSLQDDVPKTAMRRLIEENLPELAWQVDQCITLNDEGNKVYNFEFIDDSFGIKPFGSTNTSNQQGQSIDFTHKGEKLYSENRRKTYLQHPLKLMLGEEKVIKIKMESNQGEEIRNSTVSKDRIITQSTVKNLFSLHPDAVVRLRYRVGEETRYCETRINQEPCFLLPNNWPTTEFMVDAGLTKSIRAGKILETWEKRVFRVVDSELTGSCVLIDRQRVLTAAHLGFKLYEWYQIEGPGGRFNVRCLFISIQDDAAILGSDRLPDLPRHTVELKRGDKYYIMGYPSGVEKSEPTITKGSIEGKAENDFFLVGTPGSKRGYSGGPVFNDSGKLAGLLRGGYGGSDVNTTINELLASSAEQKYAQIIPIHVLNKVISDGDTLEKEFAASRIDALGKLVFQIQGLDQSGSAVLIGTFIVTAAHLGFLVDGSYRVKGYGFPETGSSVNCVFISGKHDFALLHLEHPPIFTFQLPTVELSPGSEYFIMGYPGGVEASKPTLTKGIIRGVVEDGLYDGTLYSNHDYSGAPAFNDSGSFAGILISATTKPEVPEEKLAKILSIDAIYADYHQSTEKTASRISNLGNRVVHIRGSNGSWRSGMLMGGFICTDATGFNFQQNESYLVKGSGLPKEGSLVTCIFLSGEFALFASDHLPDVELYPAELSPGSECFIMGYPGVVENSELKVTTGIVREVNGGHLVITPGSNQDYSGAPVFADPENFAGILINAGLLDSSGARNDAKFLPCKTFAEVVKMHWDEKAKRLQGRH